MSAYLVRLPARPKTDSLAPEEVKFLNQHFEAESYELHIDGQAVEIDSITEVEVAVAARQNSPAGWLVKKLLYAGERYHVGVYAGRQEYVLPNVTLPVAQYIVQTIAFYARNSVRYKGVEGLTPVTE